uniref:Uncharacterized protein n=1 Tax=Oryza sativa subsp. japonica TaxID=39947 RepID=Q67V79_ORYSJ|nr:hypothetical protein [Oryza sativa Japonica Group]BAD37940.1 hypothetical protein [Oryza sativa Japonica Group]
MPPVPDHRRRLPQSHTLAAVVAARDDLGSGGDSDGGQWRLGTTSATSGGSGGVRWRVAVATAGGDHGSVFAMECGGGNTAGDDLGFDRSSGGMRQQRGQARRSEERGGGVFARAKIMMDG